MKHLVFYSSFIAFIASTIIYIMTLVKFIGDSSMNEIMFLISLIISIITSFIFIMNLGIIFKKNALVKNIELKSVSIVGYISLVLLSLFGASLIVDSLINRFNAVNLAIGIILVMIHLYTTFIYFISTDDIVFEVSNIEFEKDINLYCVDLVNDEYGFIEYYIKDKKNIEIDKSYLCKFNKGTQSIKKITKEVINIK